jgi:Amt family ammonium transporter
MGAVVGLVAITPAAGVVPPLAAIPIGLGAGLFGCLAVRLKHWLPVDDPLDAWPIHSVGGIWGAVATGLFATAAVNAAGGNGLLAGNPSQLLNEVVGVVVVALYAGAMTWMILKLLGLFMTLRVAKTEEELGLDVSQHGETAYAFYQGLTRRLLTAREEERRRVAYEVHDGLAQMVTSTHQHLQAYAHQHPSDLPEAQA